MLDLRWKPSIRVQIDKGKQNLTVSASIVEPSPSLRAATRPSAPGSKFLIEAP